MKKNILALLAGATLTLAFAPSSYWPIAIFSPAVLLFLISEHSDKQPTPSFKSAFLTGYCYGIGFFATSVSWVYISIYVYGDTPAILAACITALFITYLALFPALFALLTAKLWLHNHSSAQYFLIPLFWTVLEWLRGIFLTGFPWGFVGITTIDTPLAGWVPILGVYGLSFVCLYFSSVLIKILTLKKSHLITHLLLITSIFSIGQLLKPIDWTTATKKPLTVALVQPNIPQDLKWLSEHQQSIIDTTVSLTNPYWDYDLIVWPESAITVPLPYSESLVNQLDTKAAINHSTLITGIPQQAKQSQDDYKNIIISLGSKGKGYYAKRHLVPFGEYLPLASLLRGIIGFFDLPMSNFISGDNQQHLLQAGGIKFQAALCYEIAYPELTLNGNEKSEALLTLSNDTWFGHSIGPKQHLQMARFRALESGRPLLRATNNGITAIIDHHGSLIKTAEPFIETVLTGTLVGRTGQTPLTYYGHHRLLIFLSLIGLFLIGLISKRRLVNQDRVDNAQLPANHEV